MLDNLFTDYNFKSIFANKDITKHGRAKGGMLVGFNKVLSGFIEYEYFNDMVILRINNDKQSVHIMPIYLSCTSWWKDFNNLCHYYTDFSLNNCILIGDCKARISDLQINPDVINLINTFNNINSKDTIVNAEGRRFVEFAKIIVCS